MALAQRLNELAIANSEGLLNDDEYRLLRQNVFEQYSSNAIIPVEAPLVPIARVHVQLRGASPSPGHRRPTPKPLLEQPKPGPSPVRPKATVMASLIRRATGRKTPNPINDPSTTKDPRKGSDGDHPCNDTPKLSVLIPRILHKKPANTPSLRTDAPHLSTATPHSASMFPAARADDHHSFKHPLPTPSGSGTNFTAPPLSPTHPEKSMSMIRDVFDEDHLTTAKDIRNAITYTEDEARRLVDAFNNLEASTLRRIRKQRARRLPTTTPANVNVLLEGREWREHRLISSPSSPLFDTRQRHMLSSVESNSDGVSVRSGSSNKTSLSQSKSISSLPKHPPVSPLSPQSHFRAPSIPLGRKSSISSMSSQTPSLTSPGKLGVNTHSTLTRSTSHAALRTLKGSRAMTSTDTVAGLPSGAEEADDDPELADIRKRRDDLIARYTSRLEFLRAKLKGAELHEKLLRK